MIIKTRTKIMSEMIEWARNNNSSITNYNKGGVARAIFNALSAQLAQLYYNVHQVFRSARIMLSNGDDLELAVAPRSMKRRTASFSTVPVIFSGVAATTIPQGTKVGTVGGIEYATTESEALAANGKATLSCQATIAGASSMIKPGEISVIVDIVSGLTEVSNDTPSIGGYDFESDELLRNRAITQLSTLSQGIEASYQAWAQESHDELIRAKPQMPHPQYSQKTVVIHCLRNNGGIFTDTQLSAMAAYIQHKAPLGIVVVCLNMVWMLVDVTAEVVLYAGYDINAVRDNVILNLQLYMDYREWDWGADVDFSDLYSLVNNSLGISDIQRSSFSPATNVQVGAYLLPKIGSVSITE